MNRRLFLSSTARAALATAVSSAVSSPMNAAAPDEALLIDTHQHLWDVSSQKLPWLGGAPKVLNRSYTTDDYRAATRGLNVKAVYMEVDVAPEQHVREAESVLSLISSNSSPTVAAVIGGSVASPEFPAYVGRFRGNPLIKGVRQVLHGDATPAGYCLQESFVKGVRQLGAQGMSFDLCMRAVDLMDAAKLVSQCPDTRFVLDHCGNPDLKAFRPSRDGEEKPKHTADEWRRAIDAIAKNRNVIGKISGVAASLPKGGDASDLAPAVNHCLDAFGADRVVFGGDWPVCLLGAEFSQWLAFLKDIVSTRPAADRQKLWSSNAIRHYALRLS
jgi:predicted TIM-barrel fold metal-dependent hydrolase